MKIPESLFSGPGLIRTTQPDAPSIDSAQRAGLIRRGNAFFNDGKIEAAKKIFLTTHYSDGLIRIGDHYYKKNDFISALQMYALAPDQVKMDDLLERIAIVIRKWLTN